ncbi:MAG: Sapep family Mn(2+)-dependent dipeptidase [Clostridia bacterium]|nr:Sapep family Mn(2+)-dependent dipeptidase [Clostridia bacterium]
MEQKMQTYFGDIVRSTVDILRFDSSLKEAEEGYPFGKETADCLQFFLDLAASMGFETHNYDNYVGEVVFGEGEGFAILAHLDVVPAGSGWKFPPFGGVINDVVSDGGVEGMKIWGRGAMDDKTPAIVCLYALKALKDEGFVPGKQIKLIVGCNEETGWKCIEHYNKVAKMPKEGFSPDADFPVIYAEKGIVHFTTAFSLNEAPMSALKAGTRANMVCDFCECILTRKAAEHLVGYENPIAGTTLSYDNTTNILRAYGKSAHGSTPNKGANALQATLCFLASFDEDCKNAYDLLFNDVTGLKTMQDETGSLTMSPNVATFANGVLKITTDVRYPATHTLQEVTAKLDGYGAEYTLGHTQDPLYNDPDSKLISTLMGIYNAAMGENEKPIAIGGGTYARALKNGCAFGPAMPNEEDTIHQVNEYVTFERIRFMSEMYYQAIKELTKAEKQATPMEEPIVETIVETVAEPVETPIAEEHAEEIKQAPVESGNKVRVAVVVGVRKCANEPMSDGKKISIASVTGKYVAKE